MVESRLRLEAEVRQLLREVSSSAEQALSKAREVIVAGSIAVAGELERLEKTRAELKGLFG